VTGTAGLFTTYDIGTLIKGIWLEKLLDTVLSDTNIGKAVVASLRDSVDLGVLEANGWAAALNVTIAEVQALTTTDLMNFLLLNQTWGSTHGESWIGDFVWMADIRQPVYFAAGGIYIGNGNPAPDGFTSLAQAPYLTAYQPKAVRDLRTAFIWEMHFQ
jgi:hypothetical protein